MAEKILVTGATGQIGSELVPALREIYGGDNVIAVGHKKEPDKELLSGGPFERCDATDKDALLNLVDRYKITIIYHLVGILSATAEKIPAKAWEINMGSLRNVLDISIEKGIKKVFWPSSIAAFGPSTPLDDTPQRTVLEPNTMYGVTKVAGELLCNYYFEKFNLDVRSLRYPGVNSWKTPPGGGTTDFAVAIYYDALKKGSYECFVSERTMLPMMYMDDAVRATIELMDAPAENITVRTSYNLTAMSFTAGSLAENVAKHVPEFKCTFKPDFRQRIADSWPNSVDDSIARKDWGWKPAFDLDAQSVEMIKMLKKKFGMDD